MRIAKVEIYTFVLLLLVSLSFANLKAQTDTAFWFAIPRFTPYHPGAGTGGKPARFIVSALGPTTVTISMPANPSFKKLTKIFTAAGTDTFDVSYLINKFSPASSIENAAAGTETNTPKDTILNKGFYIQSDRNFITAYYEVDHIYNRDIFSLKGRNALGTYFICPFQKDFPKNVAPYAWSAGSDGGNGNYPPEQPYSAIEIVATENNTQIDITPSVDVYNHLKSAGTYTITLNKGQTYQVRAKGQAVANHMGGTIIQSNKKIAITIKDDSVIKKSARDMVGDQLIPVSLTGKEYIVMRSKIDEINGSTGNPVITEGVYSGEDAYIYATVDGTVVKAKGVVLGTINKGQMLDLKIQYNATFIEASAPIYIFHVAGFSHEPGGAVLPTIEGCTGSKSVSLAKNTQAGAHFYLNIMSTDVGRKNIFISYSKGGVKYNRPIPQDHFALVDSSPNWWALKAQYKQFDTIDNGFFTVYSGPNGDRFHLGIFDGINGVGCKYGYFSDFGVNEGNVNIFNNPGENIYEACYSEPIQLVASGGLSYKWTLTGAVGGVTYLSNENIANPIASPVPGIYEYKVTIHPACGADTTLPVTVSVLPQAISSFEVDTSIRCSPNTTFNFSNTSPNADTLEFFWDFYNDGTPEISGLRSAAPVSFTYPNNNTGNPVIYYASLKSQIRESGRCFSSDSVKVTIMPSISASFTKDKNIDCNPLLVTFKNKSTGDTSGCTYKWDYGNGINFTKDSVFTRTFENLYSPKDTTYKISLLATSDNNCSSTYRDSVKVHRRVKADFTIDTIKGCADFKVTINNNAIGDIHSWNLETSILPNDTNKIITKTYSNNTSASINRTILLTAKNIANCSDTLSRVVTVLPKTVASITASPVIGCNELDVLFSTPANTPTVNYNWDFEDGSSTTQNPSHHFINNSGADMTFNTSLTVSLPSGECPKTDSKSITVHSKLNPKFVIDKIQGCSGFISTITTNTDTAGITNYTVDYGDGTIVNQTGPPPVTLTHQYFNTTSTTVNYTLSLTVSNGPCSETYSVSITVNPGVAASFTENSTSGCSPLEVELTNTSDMTKATGLKWEFGDGTSSNTYPITHIYTNNKSTDTTFILKLIVFSTTGCIDTTTKTIIVYSNTNADFNITSPSSGCSPFTVNFKNTSTGGIVSNVWKYGDGSIDTTSIINLNHLYINKSASASAKVDTVCLIVENNQGCKDSIAKTVSISPEVKASFAPTILASCNPLSSTFNNSPDGISTTYLWDFDDGASSNISSPTHIFNNTDSVDKNYNVKLTATSALGCSDDTTISVTSYVDINPGFSLDQATVCSNTSVKITKNSDPGNKFYIWDFDGDGTPDDTILSKSPFFHTFTNFDTLTKVYNVKLTTKNAHNCFKKDSTDITVHPQVTAAFSMDVDTGCTPLAVTFTNASNIVNVNSTIFDWDFDDGGGYNKKDTNHIFNNIDSTDKVYHTKLTVTSGASGCSDDTTIDVTAYAYITADYNYQTANNNNTSCSNSPILFTNASSAGVAHKYWDFTGTGTNYTEITSNSFSRSFVNNDSITQPFKILLKTQNNHQCFKYDSTTINIFPEVIASFNFLSQDTGCQPLNVSFLNNTNIFNEPGTQFNWDFDEGGGMISSTNDSIDNTFENNDYTKPDTFNIKLTATSQIGCDDDTIRQVIAFRKLQADFNLSKSEVCTYESVTLTNLFPSAHNYWDYDNLNKIEDNNPAINKNFTNSTSLQDTVSVRLIVQNNHWCFDTISKPLIVDPFIDASFTIASLDHCQPDTIDYLNTTNLIGVSGISFNWNLGNGSTPVTQDATGAIYINNTSKDSTYNPRLIATYTTASHSCKDTAVNPVEIYALTTAGFNLPKTTICSNEPLVIVNTPSGGVDSCEWDLDGNGTFDTITGKGNFNFPFDNPNVNPATHKILQRVIHKTCTDTISHAVTVNPRVIAQFVIRDSVPNRCDSSNFNFDNTSSIAGTAGTSYLWNFGDGANANTDSSEHIFGNNTADSVNYTTSLVITSQFNCSDTFSKVVTIYPYVNANISIDSSSICSDAPITIHNNSSIGVKHTYWTYSDGTANGMEDNSSNVTHAFTNNLTVKDTFEIKIVTTNQSPQCMDSAFMPVIVFPKVNVDFTMSDTAGCEPLKVTFTNNSPLALIPPTKSKWTFGDGNASENITGFIHYFSNPSTIGNDTTYHVKLEIINENNCSNSITKDVIAYARINAGFNINQTGVCAPDSLSILNNYPAGVKFNYWDFNGDGNNDSIINKKSFKWLYKNNTTKVDTVDLKLTVQNNHSQCTKTATQKIFIYPQVKSNFAFSADSGCQPLSNTLINLTNIKDEPNTTFLWIFGDGGNSSDKNPTHTFNNLLANDRTYPVKLIATSEFLCTHDTTINLNVFGFIDADFSVPKAAICSDIENLKILNYANGQLKECWWDYDGDNSEDIENKNSEITDFPLYNYTLDTLFIKMRSVAINNHGCTDTAYNNIMVFPSITPGYVPSVDIGCEPLQVTFYNTTNIKNNQGTKFFWDFGNGNNSNLKDTVVQTYTNETNNDVLYLGSLKVISRENCTVQTPLMIQTFSHVDADFTFSSSEICSGDSFEINDLSHGGINKKEWDFNSNGSFDFTGNLTFLKDTNTNNDTISRYLKLRVQNIHGCADSISRKKLIYPLLNAGFTMDTSKGCQPLSVKFKNNTNIAGSNGMTYNWDFGVNTSLTIDTITVAFPNPGSQDSIYTISLTAKKYNKCPSIFTKTVRVFPFINADFKVDSSFICSGLNINITDASSPGINHREWSFGDGKPNQINTTGIFNHLYENKSEEEDTFKLKLVADYNGFCTKTFEKNIIVYPEIRASFEPSVNEGCEPLEVEFENGTNLSGNTYDWTFGNAGTSKDKNPEKTFDHTAPHDSLFVVNLHAVSKHLCTSDVSHTIKVYPYIAADFKVPDNTICSGESVIVNDTSEGGIVTRKWDYNSDGIIDLTNSPLTFQIPYDNLTNDSVIYKLKLTVYNNHAECFRTISRNIIVYPKVTAGFESDTVGCHPFIPVKIKNITKNGFIYDWNFGDGGSSPIKEPMHTFENLTEFDKDYKTTLVATSQFQCKDSFSRTYRIFHKPITRIGVDNPIGCPPFTPTIYNYTKTSGSTYVWNFGEGTNLPKNNKDFVTHTYGISPSAINSKPYIITLYATTTSFGCKDTATLTISVYPKVTANFDSITPDCNPIEVKIKNRSFNATDYLWDFGDGYTDKQEQPTHLFQDTSTVDKTFTITLVSSSENGCSDTISKKLLVYPSPKASFITNPIVQFYPDATFKITDLTNPGPYRYNWDFGNGVLLDTIRQSSFSYLYPHWGKYDITLKVNSTVHPKCADTISQEVLIYAPRPIANFDSSAEGCSPVTVSFKNNSKYGEQYIWTFDDGSKGSFDENPSHTFFDPGEYNVQLTVLAEGGTATHYELVKVYEKPEVDFSAVPTLAMIPDDKVRFFNSTIHATNYSWDFGDGSEIDTSSNPDHYYKELGKYSVKLVARNEYGCSDSLERVGIIEVMGKGKIMFPNAFTPNMTGSLGGSYAPNATDNNVFFPYHEGVAEYHMEIYDRWGEKIFTSNNVNIGWDGYYKGKLCKQDVYVYKASGKFYNGRTYTVAGDLTLLHSNH